MSTNDNSNGPTQTVKGYYYAPMPAGTGGGYYESTLSAAGNELGPFLVACASAFFFKDPDLAQAVQGANPKGISASLGSDVGSAVGRMIDDGSSAMAVVSQNLSTFFAQFNDPTTWMPPDINGD